MLKNNNFTFDASTEPLGRLASKIAKILIGKDMIGYRPNIDNQNKVVVYNIEKVVLTGKKSQKKLYIHHTGYPGGLRIKNISEVLEKYPARILYEAIKGMLPKNRLQAHRLKRLTLIRGPENAS